MPWGHPVRSPRVLPEEVGRPHSGARIQGSRGPQEEEEDVHRMESLAEDLNKNYVDVFVNQIYVHISVIVVDNPERISQTKHIKA